MAARVDRRRALQPVLLQRPARAALAPAQALARTCKMSWLMWRRFSATWASGRKPVPHCRRLLPLPRPTPDRLQIWPVPLARYLTLRHSSAANHTCARLFARIMHRPTPNPKRKRRSATTLPLALRVDISAAWSPLGGPMKHPGSRACLPRFRRLSTKKGVFRNCLARSSTAMWVALANWRAGNIKTPWHGT